MNCTVCSGNSRVVLLLDEINVFKCDKCGHEYSEHQSNIDFSIYDESYYEKEHENWFKNPNINLFSKLDKYIEKYKSKSDSIFDIGCGRGDFLFYLKNKKYNDLNGIDLSKNEIDETIQFLQGDIFEYDSKIKYDTVVNLAVIEHLNNLNQFSDALEKFVNKDGLLIVMTIDSESFLYNSAKLLYKIGINFPVKRLYSEHHVNHFTKKSLRLLLEKNNFNVVEHFNTNFPVEAIDMDKGIFKPIVLFVVKCIFFLTNKGNSGMLQTIVLKKK